MLPTLSVVFPLMASPPNEDDECEGGEEDDENEFEDGIEASRPCAVASQVLYLSEGKTSLCPHIY